MKDFFAEHKWKIGTQATTLYKSKIKEKRYGR